MTSEHDCRLARLALQKGYLTRGQIRTCLSSLRGPGPGATLEEVLLEQGYLTAEEIDELSRLVSDDASGEGNGTGLFARIARRQGAATEDQIEDALRFKRALAARRIRRPLGQILVERGVMSARQVDAILDEQQRAREAFSEERLRFKAYVPGEPIGKGSRGSVHRARHASHGDVALKIIPSPGCAPGALDRLRRLRALEHPHLARVFDAGPTGHGLYVASEHVEGIPLLDHVVGSMRLSRPEAARILGQTAAALEALHAAGLAHGNLKPQNVLLTERRQVKLTDAGLGPDGSGPAEDLLACRALWRFMLTGNPRKGGVPPLRFGDARTLRDDLARAEI